MADIFISYKREDRPTAEQLSRALQQLGFEVWWDFELLSGENFRKAIRAIIDQCKVAVVVWSKTSAESSFVLDEASYALRLGRLCPVRIDAVELPLGFGQTHVDDLSDWEGELSHSGFQTLVKSIEQRVGRRARFGSGASPLERQTATAELEAFKAAQLAGSVNALRTFTSNFPATAFAAFVRDQIETMETEAAAKSRTRGMPTLAESTPTAPAPTTGSAHTRWSWKLVAASVAAIAAVGVGLVMFNDAARQAQEQAEVVRAKAQEERVATEERARELEKQAATERAARERAEQRSELLQRQADQERQARELAARAEVERKRRDATFNLDLLHRDVRGAVEAARLNAQRAESAATRARSAAIAAETAAERSRAGLPGTISLSFEGGVYLGEGSGATRNGYGVTMFRAPSIFAGDRYAGQYQDNGRSGVGVYSLANNANNKSLALRREGEYARNKPNGFSVLLWASGDRHAGQWREGSASGPGVRSFADGRRYEGEFAADKRNGLGVLWSADGRVLSAGLWKDSNLVTPLVP